MACLLFSRAGHRSVILIRALYDRGYSWALFHTDFDECFICFCDLRRRPGHCVEAGGQLLRAAAIVLKTTEQRRILLGPRAAVRRYPVNAGTFIVRPQI